MVSEILSLCSSASISEEGIDAHVFVSMNCLEGYIIGRTDIS